MLQHIIATPREDGLYLFKAEEGYRLYDRASQSFRPEAITTMEIARKDLEARAVPAVEAEPVAEEPVVEAPVTKKRSSKKA